MTRHLHAEDRKRSADDALYRGSTKHKNRPANEQKGTLCPEWTHTTPGRGLAHDVHRYDWEATAAARLFRDAEACENGSRRYATERGIAFEAKATRDGTWHGFPIPWEHVPDDIKDRWLTEKKVSRKQIRDYFRFDQTDIHWALKTDEDR